MLRFNFTPLFHTLIDTCYVYVCTGLKIGGVASQNANHWGNCKSFWQSESQNNKSLLADLQITFQMVSQKDLFFGPHPIFRQNFSFFRYILCK